jgi:hypothetical protein
LHVVDEVLSEVFDSPIWWVGVIIGIEEGYKLLTKDENGRKTPQSFSTFIFEYENKSENGKA